MGSVSTKNRAYFGNYRILNGIFVLESGVPGVSFWQHVITVVAKKSVLTYVDVRLSVGFKALVLK